MNLFKKTLSKIFKCGNQQELDKIRHLIKEINDLEPSMATLNDSDLKKKLII